MNGSAITQSRLAAPYSPILGAKKSQSTSALPEARSGVRASDSFELEHLRYSDTKLRISDSQGRVVDLSMESVEYTRTSGNSKISNRGAAEAFHKIREETLRIQKIVVSRILANVEGRPQEVESEDDDALRIPEEWNAENTSNRIVDFAVGLRNAFEGADAEFLEMIKGAVEEGFEQAREILGALPDKVQALMEETYSLVMEKLDRWAEDRLEVSESTENEGTAVDELPQSNGGINISA